MSILLSRDFRVNLKIRPKPKCPRFRGDKEVHRGLRYSRLFGVEVKRIGLLWLGPPPWSSNHAPHASVLSDVTAPNSFNLSPSPPPTIPSLKTLNLCTVGTHTLVSSFVLYTVRGCLLTLCGGLPKSRRTIGKG